MLLLQQIMFCVLAREILRNVFGQVTQNEKLSQITKQVNHEITKQTFQASIFNADRDSSIYSL